MDSYHVYSVQQDNEQTKPQIQDLSCEARLKFIRKVYILLTLQILFTVIVTACALAIPSFARFQLQYPFVFYLCLVLLIIIEIYVFCCGGARTHPFNLLTVGLFTLCQSYIVSFICSLTSMSNGSGVVLLAAVYTLAVTVACTAYACSTKTDFTTMGGVIVVLGVLLLMLMLLSMFTESKLIDNIYCGVGALIFAVYLIVDTQMIMGGKSIELSVDQYCLATLVLYIDIVQIFLYLLQLLKNND